MIEHVGDEQKQRNFINEMLRVGENVFFTTPNKFFPFEPHTNIFFRHWFQKSFYNWCKVNKPYWGKNNLALLSYFDIKRIMKESKAKKFLIFKNRTLFLTMTLTVVCSK